MADEHSVQLLCLNFGYWTFARQRLVQELSRTLSAFTSVFRGYLDPVVKESPCAQYVDDIDVAAHTASQLIENLYNVFKRIQKAGLFFLIEICQLGKNSKNILRKTASTAGLTQLKNR